MFFQRYQFQTLQIYKDIFGHRHYYLRIPVTAGQLSLIKNKFIFIFQRVLTCFIGPWHHLSRVVTSYAETG